MNVLHIKYAVEIAKTKSISKAAESLYTAQPNLSRAIKELEEDIGITIFKRTSKGIAVTPEGEEFLQYARRIVEELDEIENIYKNEKSRKQKFSVSVPRAGYIAQAFAEFTCALDDAASADIYYKETSTENTVNNVFTGEYNLGIIRYPTSSDKYFKSVLSEKKLAFETITEFSCVILVSENHPLAKKQDIVPSNLSGYVEITHADAPSVPGNDTKKTKLSENPCKRITVFERASQLVLLEKVPGAFMWTSPVPDELMKKYNLVQIKFGPSNKKLYKDVLIYRNGYQLTELDKRFITDVCNAKRKYLSN